MSSACFSNSAARKFVNPLFLHKCDLKWDQTFIQVLKLDKRNQLNKYYKNIYTYPFIYLAKLSNITCLCWKKYVDLGVISSFKEKI